MTPRQWAGRTVRGAWLGLRVRLSRGSPTVAFLPAVGDVSELLRMTLVARGLHRRGWRAHVLHQSLSAAQRRRALAALSPDIVVVKGARNPLNRRPHLDGYRYAVDLDDADFHDPALAPALEDLAKGATGFIAGSAHVARWARAFCPDTRVIWTGTPVLSAPRQPHASRAPIITWAQSNPVGYPAERAFVGEVLARVLQHEPEVRLRLYGRKPGMAESALTGLLQPGIRLDWRPPLPYTAFLRSLRDAAIGLAPLAQSSPYSRGKSFGKILGYLEAKVPVICSDAAEHARFFTPGAEPPLGLVSNDPAIWAAEIRRLLAAPEERQSLADTAFATFERRLTIDASTERMAAYLRHLLESGE